MEEEVQNIFRFLLTYLILLLLYSLAKNTHRVCEYNFRSMLYLNNEIKLGELDLAL